jgi:hypothetical protein
LRTACTHSAADRGGDVVFIRGAVAVVVDVIASGIVGCRRLGRANRDNIPALAALVPGRQARPDTARDGGRGVLVIDTTIAVLVDAITGGVCEGRNRTIGRELSVMALEVSVDRASAQTTTLLARETLVDLAIAVVIEAIALFRNVKGMLLDETLDNLGTVDALLLAATQTASATDVAQRIVFVDLAVAVVVSTVAQAVILQAPGLAGAASVRVDTHVVLGATTVVDRALVDVYAAHVAIASVAGGTWTAHVGAVRIFADAERVAGLN